MTPKVIKYFMSPVKCDVHKNSTSWAEDVLMVFKQLYLNYFECGFWIPDHLGSATCHETFRNMCLSFLIWNVAIYYSLSMVSIP